MPLDFPRLLILLLVSRACFEIFHHESLAQKKFLHGVRCRGAAPLHLASYLIFLDYFLHRRPESVRQHQEMGKKKAVCSFSIFTTDRTGGGQGREKSDWEPLFLPRQNTARILGWSVFLGVIFTTFMTDLFFNSLLEFCFDQTDRVTILGFSFNTCPEGGNWTPTVRSLAWLQGKTSLHCSLPADSFSTAWKSGKSPREWPPFCHLPHSPALVPSLRIFYKIA